MDERCRKLLSVAFVCLTVISFSACKSKNTEAPAEPIAKSYNDTSVGTIVDSVGFNVSLHDVSSKFYEIHKTSSWSAACTAVEGEDLACYIDGLELDLYARGLEFRYNVPTNMCKYFRLAPYYYYNLEPGIGAETFSYDIGSNSLPQNMQIGGAHAANSYWSGTTPKCNYDYTGANGPNCCLGTYTLSTRTWDNALSSDPVTGAPIGGWVINPSTTVEWGGKPANCLQGPAMATQDKSSSGFPMPTLLNVEGKGLNEKYSIEAPIKKLLGSTVYVANFSAAVLANPHTRLSWGKVFQSATNVYPTTIPYYELTCFDSAREIKSRIRLYVREWNSVAEWENRKTTGTPDAGGAEAGYPSQPIGDYNDWADLGDGATFPAE